VKHLPFDPERYVSFAQSLFSQKDSVEPDKSEAAARTVISRAYYGTFLRFREHLLSLFKRLSPLGDEYEELYEKTDMHGVVIGVLLVLDYAIGDGLDQLRKARNRADYNLVQPIMWGKAEECLGVASSVLAADRPSGDDVERKLERVEKIVTSYYVSAQKRKDAEANP
jgi:hypothetical protein